MIYQAQKDEAAEFVVEFLIRAIKCDVYSDSFRLACIRMLLDIVGGDK